MSSELAQKGLCLFHCALSCPVAFHVLFITAVGPGCADQTGNLLRIKTTPWRLQLSPWQRQAFEAVKFEFLSYGTSKGASQAQLPITSQRFPTADGRSTRKDGSLAEGSLEEPALLLPEGDRRARGEGALQAPGKHHLVTLCVLNFSTLSRHFFRKPRRGVRLGGCYSPSLKEQLCLLIPVFHFKASSFPGRSLGT